MDPLPTVLSPPAPCTLVSFLSLDLTGLFGLMLILMNSISALGGFRCSSLNNAKLEFAPSNHQHKTHCYELINCSAVLLRPHTCITPLSKKWEVASTGCLISKVYSLSNHSPHSLFPLWNHITPPSSPPRSPLSILSQSHLVNMSRPRLRNLISGDGGTASEVEMRRGISQKRLTGERGGGEWDGKWMWGVFRCCHSTLRDLSQASWAPSWICLNGGMDGRTSCEICGLAYKC